jgi:hypothetical protein
MGLVQDAWQWSALRSTETFNTVASTASYALTGAGNNVTIESVTIPAEQLWLNQRDMPWYTRTTLNSTLEAASTNWIANGVDGSGDFQMNLWPTPDAIYAVEVECFKRQDDMTANADVLLVPSQPVLLLALAMVARERGEVGGQTAAELFQVARQSLADSIGHDKTKDDAQLDWFV